MRLIRSLAWIFSLLFFISCQPDDIDQEVKTVQDNLGKSGTKNTSYAVQGRPSGAGLKIEGLNLFDQSEVSLSSIVSDGAGLLDNDVVAVMTCGSGKKGYSAVAFDTKINQMVINLVFDGGEKVKEGDECKLDIYLLGVLKDSSNNELVVLDSSRNEMQPVSVTFPQDQTRDGILLYSTPYNSDSKVTSAGGLDIELDQNFATISPPLEEFTTVSASVTINPELDCEAPEIQEKIVTKFETDHPEATEVELQFVYGPYSEPLYCSATISYNTLVDDEKIPQTDYGSKYYFMYTSGEGWKLTGPPS